MIAAKKLSVLFLLPVLFIVLIFSAISATQQLSASLQYYFVKNRIEEWRENGTVTSSDYISTKSSAQKLVSFSSENPLYSDVLADVYQWGIFSGVESSPSEALQQSMLLYKQSVSLRPAWPVTWANMALLKWRMEEFDDDFRHYLQKADSLGKSQPEVHLLIAEFGLMLYHDRNPLYAEFKSLIKTRVFESIMNPQSRKQALKLIKAYDAKKPVCSWFRQRSDADFANLVVNC